jgi:hypothetical protein
MQADWADASQTGTASIPRMSIICCKDIHRAAEILLIDAVRLASGELPALPSPATIFFKKISRRTC